MAQFCLINPRHVSFQPRLLREADALYETGQRVRVVSQKSDSLLTAHDQFLMQQRKWRLQSIDLLRNGCHSTNWLTKSLQTKLCKGLFDLGWRSVNIAASAYTKGCDKMKMLAACEKTDWFIAHTQAALPIAAFAARRWKARFGFDCEDLLAENSPDPPEIVRLLEKNFLPLCDYVSVPSKQIKNRLVKDYAIRPPIVLYNVFPRSLAEGLIPPNQRPKGSVIRLHWFGQTIGPGRGIEEAIIAIGKLNQKVEFCLRGRVSKTDQVQLLKLSQLHGVASSIKFLPIVNHEKLIKTMGEFDIGLSLERIERTNYALTVTNKIFGYMLAGLAIAATNTPGNREVLEHLEPAGFLYPPGNPDALAKGLKRWIEDIHTLRLSQQAAWDAARKRFCWDMEKEKFLRIFQEPH